MSVLRTCLVGTLRPAFLALLFGVVMVGSGRAQILYWDTNGATTGSGGANGTWGTNNFWSTNSAGTSGTGAFVSGRDTVFSAGTNATGSYTVTVNGTQNVSSINVEEGAPTFTGGTINFNDATPDFTVNTGLTATVNSVIAGGNFSGNGIGLTKLGAGTLLLGGANTYTGVTTISVGTVQLTHAGGLGAAANNTTVTSGAVLQLANNITTTNTGTLTLNGTGIGGSGALQNGSGSNAWNSNISLGSNATISSSTAATTLTLGNAGGTSTFAMGANTATFDGAGDTRVNSVISGSNGLTKLGTGTLLLAGANTFTGATNINAGTVRLQTAGGLGTASNSSNTTVASGAVLQLTNNITTTNSGTLVLNGTGTGSGALQNLSGSNLWNSNITLGSNATIVSSVAGQTLTLGNASGTSLFTMGANTVTFDGAGDTWLNSNVGVSGDTGGLIKNGTGKLTLYGYNSYYTGATVVNDGSVDLIVGPFSPGVNAINGSLTIGDGTGAASSANVKINSNSFTNQLSSTSNVTVNSDGIFNVGASTGLGSLTLNGGNVDINYSDRILSPTGSITSNATSAHQTALISGGHLALGSTTVFTVARDALLTSDLTISSIIEGSGGLTKAGLGILTLSGANTYTGATTVNAGTLLLGASNVIADTSTLTIASGATVDLGAGHSETVASLSGAGTLNIRGGFTSGDASNTSFSGTIVDSGGFGTFTKQGTGTLTLSGTNTYTGVTNISAGAIVAASNGALGTSTANNVIANNAALHLQGGITLTEGSFTVTGTGVGGTGAIRNLSGNNTLDATLNLGGNTTFTSDAGTLTVPATGTVNLGSGNILTVAGAGDTHFAGVVSGNSALTKTGAGTLTLSGSGANTFNGALNVNDGTVVLNKTAGTDAVAGNAINVGDGSGAAGSAVLRLGASNQIANSAGLLTIASDGLLDLNNQVEAIDRLAGNGRIDLGTTGKLTVGVNSGNSTFGGTVLGTGTLVKAGAGSLTLQATLAITGEFELNSGTVFLSGYNLSAGTLHITGNSTIDFAGGNSTLNATNFIVDAGVVLTITNWTNAMDFFFAANWTGATYNTTGSTPMNQVVFNPNPGSDTKWLAYGSHEITPVPEPSTYGAGLMAVATGLVYWRRRRASRQAA